MHPLPTGPANPLHVLSHAERLAREQPGSRMGLVFQGLTAVSLGVITAKAVFDMVREARDHDRPADGPDGPPRGRRSGPARRHG